LIFGLRGVTEQGSKDGPMTIHKFEAGQSVTVITGRSKTSPNGLFKIVRLLPQERGINQYRIKSTTDGHERVVMEGEIT
jgi:hypothetical protein